MNDDEFLRLIGQYLDDPPADPNPGMERTVIEWERESPDFGSKHIWEKHRVTEEEVEQVLFEVPPHVEARRHADHENRTVFWGATRYDRWIVVVCEDWNEGGTRFLRPITAFEPEEGIDYWVRSGSSE